MILSYEFMQLGTWCQLYLEDLIRRIVAFGTVYRSGMLHQVELDVNQVNVGIDGVIEPSANIPFPTSEVQLLGATYQHYIVSPKKLIELCSRADEVYM